MTKPYQPQLNPELAARIAESVERLELPNEALFVQICADMLDQAAARRRDLERDIARAYEDGVLALSRIVLSPEDLRRQPGGDYLNRSHTQAGETS